MLKTLIVLVWGFALAACNRPAEEPESGLDCARLFINATYQGNFKQAYRLVGNNEPAIQYINDSLVSKFRTKTSFEKDALSKTSIQILEVVDSTADIVLVSFLNAYTSTKRTMIARRRQDLWRISQP